MRPPPAHRPSATNVLRPVGYRIRTRYWRAANGPRDPGRAPGADHGRALADRGRDRRAGPICAARRYRGAYTTIQTVLNRLTGRGLLTKRRDGLAYVYGRSSQSPCNRYRPPIREVIERTHYTESPLRTGLSISRGDRI